MLTKQRGSTSGDRFDCGIRKRKYLSSRTEKSRMGIGGKSTVGEGYAKIFILWRQAEINRAISETTYW
jgi:hypothetical protein